MWWFDVLPRMKKVYFVVILLVFRELKDVRGASYGANNDRMDVPFQYSNHKPTGIKNRYHISTYSKEDSKEVTKEPDMPIQYAYEGGDSHEGEILVHNAHNQGSSHDYHQPDPDDDSPSAPAPDGYHYAYPFPPPPRPTPPPHMSKQQSDAQYAYFFIGRNLWYVPLYFSIYFVAYVGLLVLKSIARHKVLLPQLSEQAAIFAQGSRKAAEVQRSISESERKYYM